MKVLRFASRTNILGRGISGNVHCDGRASECIKNNIGNIWAARNMESIIYFCLSCARASENSNTHPIHIHVYWQ